ncbi:MAG: aminopeptidase [bacterium]
MSLDRAAKIAVEKCLNVSEYDRFLVLTDPYLYEIGFALWDAGRKRTKDNALLIIEPTGFHSAPLPEFVAEMMKLSTVIAAPTKFSISHTKARRDACASGARCATLPGITKEIMERTLDADYDYIARLSTILAEKLTNATTARVITGKNAELFLDLSGRKGFADTGLVHAPGDFSNLPAGEAYIAPLEDTAYGNLIINGAIFDTGRLNDDDWIMVTIDNGYITKLDGKNASKHIEKIFETHPKNATAVAELGIGTNPKAIVTGNPLEDEKAIGTVHIAFGDNASMGGKISDAEIHIDGIILNPTLYIDDELIIEKGNLFVK